MITAHDIGKVAALTKLGFIGKLIGKAITSPFISGSLMGGGLGALTGGITGAIAAPKGEGFSGFGRGALAGGLTGAATGGIGGGLMARRAGTHLVNDNFGRAAKWGLGAAAMPTIAAPIGGAFAGAAAAPEQKPWYQRLLS